MTTATLKTIPGGARGLLTTLQRHGHIVQWSSAKGGFNCWVTMDDWSTSNGTDGNMRQKPMSLAALRTYVAEHVAA
jgi:DNA-binding transcriptional MocR family regulator